MINVNGVLYNDNQIPSKVPSTLLSVRV
jgi:hypothetical protein